MNLKKKRAFLVFGTRLFGREMEEVLVKAVYHRQRARARRQPHVTQRISFGLAGHIPSITEVLVELAWIGRRRRAQGIARDEHFPSKRRRGP